jgi:threonine dehydratase
MAISGKLLRLQFCVNFPDLNPENIERAASLIDPVFRNTPQFVDETLCAALKRHVLLKVETLNPIRSFKGRGADWLVRSLDLQQRGPKHKIVCASAGNFGQAIAYAGRSRGIAVEVFAAEDVNPLKRARMESFGATVTLAGKDFGTAKNHARDQARQHAECIFVEDGEADAISEGAGTIGVELLQAGEIDTVVVPVGDGALITGMATWVKAHSPRTRIIGVCAAGSPSMVDSFKQGRAIRGSSNTIADGIAVTVPVAKSVELIARLVDEMVLVDDRAMIDAMRLAFSTLGLILEPSGAAGLAAIQSLPLAGDRLATVLTGSNIHPDLLPKILSSGAD